MAGGHAWFSWAKKSSVSPSRIWDAMDNRKNREQSFLREDSWSWVLDFSLTGDRLKRGRLFLLIGSVMGFVWFTSRSLTYVWYCSCPSFSIWLTIRLSEHAQSGLFQVSPTWYCTWLPGLSAWTLVPQQTPYGLLQRRKPVQQAMLWFTSSWSWSSFNFVPWHCYTGRLDTSHGTWSLVR